MKFLHCADLHLGCVGGAERMRAFNNMMDFCVHERIGVLLIAGDLFDAPRVAEKTLAETFAKMAACPSVCVLIAAGNHDPNVKGGNYDRELPGNVFLFGPEWSCAEIPAYGVRVWGAGFSGEKEPPFQPERKKRRLTPGLVDIGVLHGDLTSAGAQSDYRAVSPEAIAATGVSYLALGHIHQRSPLKRAGGTVYAYCGCLQGLGFDEVGEKGAYLGQMDENGLQMSFVRLCGSMTLEKTLDVSACTSPAQMAALYDERIGAQNGHRVSLTLTGETPAPVDCRTLSTLLEGRAARLRIEDETRRSIDTAEMGKENTLRGAFVRCMQQKLAAAEPEAREELELALRLGLQAFEGEVTEDVD